MWLDLGATARMKARRMTCESKSLPVDDKWREGILALAWFPSNEKHCAGSPSSSFVRATMVFYPVVWSGWASEIKPRRGKRLMWLRSQERERRWLQEEGTNSRLYPRIKPRVVQDPLIRGFNRDIVTVSWQCLPSNPGLPRFRSTNDRNQSTRARLKLLPAHE